MISSEGRKKNLQMRIPSKLWVIITKMLDFMTEPKDAYFVDYRLTSGAEFLGIPVGPS